MNIGSLRRVRALALIAGSLMTTTSLYAEAAQPARLADLTQLQDVSDPQISPDGQRVLYTVASADTPHDRLHRQLWVADVHSGAPRLILDDPQSFRQPQWMPDGSAVSFLAADQGRPQLWKVGLQGGQPTVLTAVTGVISDYQWRPDGQQLALIYSPVAPPRPDEPQVIDRYEFKRDGVGYLPGKDVAQIYLLRLDDPAPQRLNAASAFAQTSPRWSPDGHSIAFIASTDQTRNETLFVTSATPGSTAKPLAAARSGYGNEPAWAPDGKRLVYLSSDDPQEDFRRHQYLSAVRLDNGSTERLSAALDLDVSAARFSTDGTRLRFIVTGDRRQGVFEMSLTDHIIRPLIDGPLTVSAFAAGREGLVYIASADTRPGELFRLGQDKVTALPAESLSHLHDQLNQRTAWLPAQDIAFPSADGTSIHGLLTYPAGSQRMHLPTLLQIHGGPNAQDSHAFSFERQYLAAQGYAVLHVNYRGSAGRGSAFSHAIFADWSTLPVQDLLAGVTYLTQRQIADPARLGIGGWSFGALLTDYVIASDKRFKAAISGAGSGNRLAMYGHDQWIALWRVEFPAPWQNPELWIHNSYPFFHADRIGTPTLFLGGDKDASVPIVGGEQMFQALKVNGVPTQLIVYPGEGHRLLRPSFVRDRLERYGRWYGQWLTSADGGLSK